MSEGRVFQINVSNGGVPKIARPAAWVGMNGVEGDWQATPDVHGGPERAVCLFSLERILALQAEGHPIYPGAVGENLTITGIDWEGIAPGVQLKLGEAVRLEITRYTTPCKSIAGAFLGGGYERISQKLSPGWARVYARVLQEGQVRVGDRLVVMKQGLTFCEEGV